MTELLDLLAAYITSLERGIAAAGPDEQPTYRRRMAAAAEIGAALRQGDARELKRLIDQEEHALGWGFLLGAQGAAAEAALGKLIYRARMSGATFAA